MASSRRRHERRRAIVTGGSSGIGKAAALALGAQGCDVGITYRANCAGADHVVGQLRTLGVNAARVQLDLGNPERAHGAINYLAAALGGIDVLVNNAGASRRATLLDEDVAGWQQTLAVNLLGPWACSKAAARHMIAQGRGGRVVNVTSVLAFAARSGGGAYGASKAGLELLTKVMALELAPYGIAVNAVAPGHTATPMNYEVQELGAVMPRQPVIPAGRAGDPAEVAQAIVALAASTASYTTGASLVVDGGLLLASGPESFEHAVGPLPRGTD